MYRLKDPDSARQVHVVTVNTWSWFYITKVVKHAPENTVTEKCACASHTQFFSFFQSQVKGGDNQEKLVYQIIKDAGNKGL